jgi:hypothetical protein
MHQQILKSLGMNVFYIKTTCRVQDQYPYLQGQGHTYYLKDVHIPVRTVTLLFIEGFLKNLAQVSTDNVPRLRQSVAVSSFEGF